VSAWGLRVIGDSEGRPVQLSGKWVSYYDPDAAYGRGLVLGTWEPRAALAFPSQARAMALWRSQSVARPTRPDGQPNRPLTAYTVSVEPLP